MQQSLFCFEPDDSEICRFILQVKDPFVKILLLSIHAVTIQNGLCCPSFPALADIMGCCETTARRASADAEACGLIDVTELPGLTNDFRINWDVFPTEKEFLNVNKYL